MKTSRKQAFRERILKHPTRATILNYLPQRSVDLPQLIGRPKGVIERHVSLLKKAGLAYEQKGWIKSIKIN